MPLNPHHAKILKELEQEIARRYGKPVKFENVKDKKELFKHEMFEQQKFFYLADEQGNVIGLRITGDANILESDTFEIDNKPISTIPVQITKLQSTLLYLNLSFNQIRDLGPLQGLTKLTVLDLSRNKIRDLGPLQGLTKLTVLDLSRNKIRDLGPLQGLTKLTVLDLSFNKISDLGPLQGLTKLTELDLSFNQISDLGPLQGLTKLTVLDLRKNQISDLGPLQGLTKLTVLKLWSNQISDLKPLQWLTKLTKLDLSENQIRELPEWIINKKWFEKSDISDNPLEKPPMEVVEQGKEAIRNWFKELKKKTVEVKDIKVILMGNTRAGKTTLVNYLTHPEKNPDPRDGSTHGIKIKDWQPAELDGKAIHFWDFGGQDFYHATHKYFLTEESIYLLLWEKDTNTYTEQTETVYFDIQYWINNIRHFAPQKDIAPILLVQNKAFLYQNGTLQDLSEQKTFPEIYKSFSISVMEAYEISKNPQKTISENKALMNFETFRTELLDIAKKQMQREVPGFWEDLRDRIKQARKTNIDRWIYEQYEKIARKIDPDINLELCTNYLINRGEILYYPNIEKIKNYVFLNPQKIVEHIYEILKRDFVKNNGEFSYSQLVKELKDEFTLEQIDEYISLMKAPGFELIFKKPGNNDIYIAPQYLWAQMPEHIKEDILPEKTLAFGLHFREFMPRYLPVRFLSRYGEYVDISIPKDNYWKYGALLKIPVQGQDNPLSVVVVADMQNKRIEFYTTKDERKSHIIKAIYEQILDIVNAEDNKDKIYLYFKGKEIDSAPISLWEENLNFKNDIIEYEIKPFKFNNKVIDIKEYKDLITARPKSNITKIFISYAQENKELVDEIKKQIELGFDDNTIKFWDDYEIKDKWQSEIENNLNESDIVLVFLSTKLCSKNHFAYKYEIPLATRTNKRIIPVLLTNCLWRNMPAIVEADIVPHKAKPVNTFQPIDDGIVKAASEIIEKIKKYRKDQGLK